LNAKTESINAALEQMSADELVSQFRDAVLKMARMGELDRLHEAAYFWAESLRQEILRRLNDHETVTPAGTT
jgi:hypothetical protein